MFSHSDSPTIAIVGAGCSGALTAIQLARQSTQPLKILLLEKSDMMARGAAYSTREEAHLLNVPAARMSAFPDEPLHFLNWLKTNGYADRNWSEGSFVPRMIFGQYLESLLTSYVAPHSLIELVLKKDNVTSVTENGARGFEITTQSGEKMCADKVVFAMGNFAPRLPFTMPSQAESHKLVVSNPWTYDAFEGLQAHETVLLVGTGLTMADVVLTLKSKGHQGKIIAVSRHGLLPQTHQACEPFAKQVLESEDCSKGILHLLRKFRKFQKSQPENVNWRAMIDSLRPLTAQLWQGLSLVERQKFVRHLRVYWDVHRHRVAPHVGGVLAALIQDGQLEILGGKVIEARFNDGKIVATVHEKKTGAKKEIAAARVVCCTGPECDYERIKEPLVQSLRTQGFLKKDALGLGIDIDNNGALISAAGVPSDALFTLGPPTRAAYWESTAVPEIRAQAHLLAKTLLQGLVQ